MLLAYSSLVAELTSMNTSKPRFCYSFVSSTLLTTGCFKR